VSEHLVIRLPSRAEQKIHWLIWSNSANEIMGSGDISGAHELEQLTEMASNRTVKVLIPGGDVHLRKVDVENKMKRQLKQALPYMLEEELASDVEHLHFAQLHDESGAIYVAIVEQAKMDMWLNWLKDAQIKFRQLIPDILALPYFDEAWTSLQIDEHWIVRTGFATGVSAEVDWLPLVLEPLIAEEPVPVHCFSTVPEDYEQQWQQETEELPMQVLAQGAISCSFNLLQGQYQTKREYSAALEQWRKVAIMAGLALFFSLTYKGLQISEFSKQQELVKAEIHQVHKIIFPEIKKIRDSRIRKMMKDRLKAAGSGASDTGFLAMATGLSSAFKTAPDFQPESIKYDLKRNEIRLSGTADSFQVFEQFKVKAGEHYAVEQGSLTNKDGKVSGTLIVRAN